MYLNHFTQNECKYNEKAFMLWWFLVMCEYFMAGSLPNIVLCLAAYPHCTFIQYSHFLVSHIIKYKDKLTVYILNSIYQERILFLILFAIDIQIKIIQQSTFVSQIYFTNFIRCGFHNQQEYNILRFQAGYIAKLKLLRWMCKCVVFQLFLIDVTAFRDFQQLSMTKYFQSAHENHTR